MHIALIQPKTGSGSATFIESQRRFLSSRFDCHLLYGGFFPETYETGRPLVREHRLQSLWYSLIRRVPGPAWKAARRRSLAKFLEKSAIELVLAQYGCTGAEVTDVCREAGVPLVVQLFGFDAYRTDMLSRYSKQYREMFVHASVLVAVSRDMCDRLAEMGAPREKIRYNPCGAETDLFHGSNPGSAPATFVAAGRFVEKKAPHLTILAFNTVMARCPEARLVMVGDGPLLNGCRQAVKALGLERSVEFTGTIGLEELATLMRGARGFVQHSVRSPDGDCEGTPVAILEAGASGLPVVATRHGGIKDVVVEGETGILVDEYDIRAMSNAMRTLAEDPEKAGQLGANGRKRIVSEFSQERCLGRLAEILEEAVGGK